MFEFVRNSWFVGICGGVISGIIVFFVSNWIMSKKNNSEYVRQIESANAEVVDILKTYIADNGLPNKEVLDAIIASISRKYKVKADELYSIRIFCQELIREIIGNVYVSNDKKDVYTKQLAEYIGKLAELNFNNEVLDNFTEIGAKSDYRRRLNKQFSIMLALTTTILTVVLTLVVTMIKNDKNYTLNEILFGLPEGSNIFILSIATFAGILSLMMAFLFNGFKRKKTKEIDINKKNYVDTEQSQENK